MSFLLVVICITVFSYIAPVHADDEPPQWVFDGVHVIEGTLFETATHQYETLQAFECRCIYATSTTLTFEFANGNYTTEQMQYYGYLSGYIVPPDDDEEEEPTSNQTSLTLSPVTTIIQGELLSQNIEFSWDADFDTAWNETTCDVGWHEPYFGIEIGERYEGGYYNISRANYVIPITETLSNLPEHAFITNITLQVYPFSIASSMDNEKLLVCNTSVPQSGAIEGRFNQEHMTQILGEIKVTDMVVDEYNNISLPTDWIRPNEAYTYTLFLRTYGDYNAFKPTGSLYSSIQLGCNNHDYTARLLITYIPEAYIYVHTNLDAIGQNPTIYKDYKSFGTSPVYIYEDVGTYTISFGEKSGYDAPPKQIVTLEINTGVTVYGQYVTAIPYASDLITLFFNLVGALTIIVLPSASFYALTKSVHIFMIVICLMTGLLAFSGSLGMEWFYLAVFVTALLVVFFRGGGE